MGKKEKETNKRAIKDSREFQSMCKKVWGPQWQVPAMVKKPVMVGY
jgi:hypothetical protein